MQQDFLREDKGGPPLFFMHFAAGRNCGGMKGLRDRWKDIFSLIASVERFFACGHALFSSACNFFLLNGPAAGGRV
jgi:hypothetical protein